MANSGKTNGAWHRREKILLVAGLVVIIYEVAIAEALGRQFHFEVLIAGLALCGISITQWGDKR
jgi:hypothetical protein